MKTASLSSHSSLKKHRWRTSLLTLATGLLLAPAAVAQVTVPAGNPNIATGRHPFATWYGFERSAMIYTAGEIGASGSISQIGFYLNEATNPAAAPTKIYLKTISANTFAAATTTANEISGATLVYDATIPASAFTPNNWVNVPLTTPFVYNGTSNLEVIVETNATGGGTETSTSKVFRHSTTGLGFAQLQFWRADTNPPTGNGALSITRPNIQLTGLTPLPCAPVNVSIGTITPNSAQLSFTPSTGGTSYTITYFPTGNPSASTTITPAPTASPVALTGLSAGTSYTVTVVSNCGASATSPVFTTSFSTTVAGFVNDECAGAILLPTSASCSPTTGSNVGATPSAGIAAPGTAFGCFPAQTFVNNDVWFRIVVPASGIVRVTTSTVAGSPLTDTGLTLHTGTCGALTEVACSDDASGLFSIATAAGLTPGSTIYARVWSSGSTPTGQFGICAVEVPANDLAVAGVYSLGKVSNVTSTVPVQAVIRNNSGVALTNRTVTLTVSGATTYTNTQNIATLAAGASTTVTFTAFPLTATTGTNTITVTVPADDVTTNNSGTYTQTITPGVLSYIDDTQPLNPQGIGLSATTPNGVLAVRYSVSSATPLTAVRVHFPATTTTTTTYQVAVFDATGTSGRPGTELFTSATLARPTAAGIVTVPVTGVTVNGNFYVAVREISGNVGLGYQVEDPLRATTFYSRTGTSATWTDISTAATTVRPRLGIEAGFGNITAARNADLARAISLYPNPAHGAFTLSLPALGNERTAQLTLLNTLGQQVQTRTVSLNGAGTETQVNVGGLAAGIYTLRVQAGNLLATKQVVVE
jgi:hypothetical protein